MKILALPILAALALSGCQSVQKFDAKLAADVQIVQAKFSRLDAAANRALLKVQPTVQKVAAYCSDAYGFVVALSAFLPPETVAIAARINDGCNALAAPQNATVAGIAQSAATALAKLQAAAQLPAGKP